MERKVIQIAAYGYQELRSPTGDSLEYGADNLFALCDDGTVWWWDPDRMKPWSLVEEIPQDDDLRPEAPAT